MRGALRYARLNETWSCRVFEGRVDERFQTDLDLDLFDGALIAVSSLYDETMKRLKMPAIVVDPWLTGSAFFREESRRRVSLVWCDNRSISRRVADYLLAKDYRNFAFVNAERPAPWSKERERFFRQYLAEHEKKCSVFQADEQSLNENSARLRQWLLDLPKPVGIMAASDPVGLRVVDACRELGIQSPSEAGIVGVDNDPLLCESTSPSLTSLENRIEETIFRACDLLDRQMKGENRAGREFFYEPSLVVERGTTTSESTDDKIVLQALQLIKLNISHSFEIDEIARKIDIPRRSLETRFRRRLGCSMLDVVQDARLERARALLLETDYSIVEIAEKCGFLNENYLATVFRRRLGVSPRQFRKNSK